MANIWEKAFSILVRNLNSGLSYLITTVELYTNFSLTFSGKVPSPICGQTVILAEKCEENTYTLIEPSTDQQNISPVKNGKKQPKDIETNLTSKQCGISCESKNFRELSPTAEPFIPEKVK